MIQHFLTKYAFELYGAGPIFLSLTLFTLLIIALYSKNYLSNETGKFRYWLLSSFFSVGMVIACLAKNLETFFVGWEIVGLASFFLIGFYQTNTRSLENSLIALANYKICDVFFVLAIFLLESHQYTLAGACLILSTLAKSAQFPFSSWLYRALEGPTPSSTVFYGGLSLHLGPFLLIQNSGLWEHSPELRLLLGGLGIISAIYGFFVGSTRSDIKTSFAFASISQVGLIYIELALGWYHFALWHIVGHNILRTWNYLRSTSFFDDFFKKEHHSSSKLATYFFKLLPDKLYFHALHGFYMDQLFIFLRNACLIFFLGLSFVFTAKHLWQQTFHSDFLLLLMGTCLSVAAFVRPYTKLIYQSLALVTSQVLLLGSIFLFYIDLLEEAYILSSLLFLMGTLWALAPALKQWAIEGTHLGDTFTHPPYLTTQRHIIYLFCVISLTASPGSIQFFLQEALFDDLWNKSHTFMILALMGLTLNSFHFFKIGQQAFIYEILHSKIKVQHLAN